MSVAVPGHVIRGFARFGPGLTKPTDPVPVPTHPQGEHLRLPPDIPHPCWSAAVNPFAWFLQRQSMDERMDLESTIWMTTLADLPFDPQTTKWVSSTTTVRVTCAMKSKYTTLKSFISSPRKPFPKRLATPGPYLVRPAGRQGSQKTSPQGQGCHSRRSPSHFTPTCRSCPNSPL